MSHLNLSTDEVLSTTRAVRRRLELAVQTPSGQNRQRWDFIVVTDAEQRRALADVYRRGPQHVEPQFAAHQPGANFTRARPGEDITDKTHGACTT